MEENEIAAEKPQQEAKKDGVVRERQRICNDDEDE